MRTVTFLPDTENGASSPTHRLKQWVGSTTSNTQGVWTVDISGAAFSSVVSVTATAQSNQTSITAIPYATVRTFTPTQVSGYVLRPNSGMIVFGGSWTGSAFSTSPTNVFVHVVGY